MRTLNLITPTALLALWGLTSIVAFYFCILPIEVSFHEGQYHLSTYDSFYHARLILDTIQQFPQILEFDDKLHPPEGGAWISLAWGYDHFIAFLTIAITHLVPTLDMHKVLAFIPPFWSSVNCFLVIVLCRTLGLNLAMTSIAALAFAVSPITQKIHLIGNIDSTV